MTAAAAARPLPPVAAMALALAQPPAAGNIASEHTFRGDEDTPLCYHAWLPADGGTVGRAVLLLHRGHEHGGRWAEVAPALAGPGTAVFAWDARGHGRSPGARGDAEDFSVYVRDLDRFARHVGAAHGVGLEQLAVVAHSVGAVVAAAWVHDYAPPIRGLVLATPAFRVKLYVPLAVPGLRVLERMRPGSFIRSYVGGRLLTHDRAQAAAYDADPLVSKQISVRVLLGLKDTARRLVADAGAIRVPTLVLAAGRDAVVRRGPQRAFFDGLSSPLKEFAVLEGFSHAVFHETDRQLAVARVRGFLDRAFAAEPEPAGVLLDADQRGYTRAEHDRLRRPLPALSPRGVNFAVQRGAIRTLLRLSRGVRVGWATGFDSGESLDYVYENRPRGTSPLGRVIDRQYLGAIGWRGIRQRRVHLERLLGEAIARTHAAGRPVRLLDVAAGPGRYLLETLHRFPAVPGDGAAAGPQSRGAGRRSDTGGGLRAH